MQKDLWGKVVKEKQYKLERELKRYDRESLPDRLRRANLIKDIMTSKNGYLLYSEESFYLFNDVKSCFIFGQFAACILVCQALLEHQLSSLFMFAGKEKISKLGFKGLLDNTLKEGIIPKFIVDKLDDLRKKRNPLVHFTNYFERDPNKSIMFESVKMGTTLDKLLEKQAKEAILVTFEVINRYPFGLS